MVKNRIKKFYKSLTLWVNILVVIVSFLGLLIGNLKPELSLTVLGIVNIALRFKTRSPII